MELWVCCEFFTVNFVVTLFLFFFFIPQNVSYFSVLVFSVSFFVVVSVVLENSSAENWKVVLLVWFWWGKIRPFSSSFDALVLLKRFAYWKTAFCCMFFFSLFFLVWIADVIYKNICSAFLILTHSYAHVFRFHLVRSVWALCFFFSFFHCSGTERKFFYQNKYKVFGYKILFHLQQKTSGFHFDLFDNFHAAVCFVSRMPPELRLQRQFVFMWFYVHIYVCLILHSTSSGCYLCRCGVRLMCVTL